MGYMGRGPYELGVVGCGPNLQRSKEAGGCGPWPQGLGVVGWLHRLGGIGARGRVVWPQWLGVGSCGLPGMGAIVARGRDCGHKGPRVNTGTTSIQ